MIVRRRERLEAVPIFGAPAAKPIAFGLMVRLVAAVYAPMLTNLWGSVYNRRDQLLHLELHLALGVFTERLAFECLGDDWSDFSASLIHGLGVRWCDETISLMRSERINRRTLLLAVRRLHRNRFLEYFRKDMPLSIARSRESFIICVADTLVSRCCTPEARHRDQLVYRHATATLVGSCVSELLGSRPYRMFDARDESP